MADYILSCCSTADLSREYFSSRQIPVVFFHFELDGVSFQDDMGESVSPKELFSRMDSGADTKTSQVSTGEYIEFFEPFLKEGKDILHISFSSGLSGSYNSAVLAINDLREQYPERKIYVVDSLCASSGYGLFVDTLADMRDEGISIEELYAWAEDNKRKLNHWFFSTDLTYYIRGGRVSKAAGVVGQVLNICPLLNVNNTGHLIPREKIRGKKKVIARTFEIMKQLVQDRTDYSGKCFISHSLCEEDARRLADLIEKEFPKLNGRVRIFPIGATIGSHTGPGTVALFFWGDERGE